MEKFTVYGPPGTGKTTHLLELLSDELKRTRPEQIAFVSFTRKGTYEGVARAKEKFNLKEKDLPFFRTIHSLCFRHFDLTKNDMIRWEHYKKFSKKTGLRCLGYYSPDFTSTDDEYLHVISMNNHNPALADKLACNLNSRRLHYVNQQYARMKTQLQVIDFDDLLLRYLKDGRVLNVKTAFIDETQDLTPLQWSVVIKMFSNAEKLIVAGDDDQAVYEWSGADVSKFLNFSKKSLVLDKSYRLPEEIFKLADGVSRKIKNRKEKKFIHNGSKGEVVNNASLKFCDLKGGELILARTNYQLRLLAEQLYERGYSYSLKGKLSYEPMVIKTIKGYIDWSSGLISNAEFLKYKGKFKKPNKDVPWYEVMDLPKGQLFYYQKLISSNALSLEPINLETFHSIKGGENDHVILSLDVSKRIDKELTFNLDAELRCLYVGITRARKKLTILDPATRHYYTPFYFRR